MEVLVIDIGGTSVKVYQGDAEPARFDSGPDLTPDIVVERTRAIAAGWKYDVVSIGYPGAAGKSTAVQEPGNLGGGWVGFDFEKAFGAPVRVVNDAALQALGGYQGGRMLFVGLGTGVGSALVADRVIVPLELGCLRFDAKSTLVDRLGRAALRRDGHEAWQKAVTMAAAMLYDAFSADYLILGGGNAARVDPLPPRTRRGSDEDAFKGGVRLWEEIVEPPGQARRHAWRLVK